MRLDSLRSLFEHELQDMHDAENQLIQFLPDMAEAASDEELKSQLRNHGEEAKRHKERLERILKGLDAESGDVKCAGMRGILSEARSLIEQEDMDPSVRDAAIVSMTQKAEHYELASYGALRTYARILDEKNAQELLQETLDEEGGADDRLTSIAERSVNPAAKA